MHRPRRLPLRRHRRRIRRLRSTHPAIAPRAKNTGNLYVSIGDSYAAGFQPTGRGQGHTTRNGFAYQAVRLAARKGYHLRLVNFGCAGATTASVLHSPGCVTHYLGPGAPDYRQTQADAAVAFVEAHRGQVALITVSTRRQRRHPLRSRPRTRSCRARPRSPSSDATSACW